MPGVGHFLAGRRRAALLLVVPVVFLVGTIVGLLVAGGPVALVKIAVTPGVLPALAVLNVLLAAWRLFAGVDTLRRAAAPVRAWIIVAGFALVVVVGPHALAGTYIAATSDYLDSTFANADASPDPAVPEETDPPDQTEPPPTESAIATAETTPGTSPSDTPSAGPPTPKPTPRPPMIAGAGTLPDLGASIPWKGPGEVPWGDDGRFDLLLLGSDAGSDRWSRRMDVMLLVEVDVTSGKVAMIGLPRNLVNAPFPPGAARDASPCGCFRDLLNAMYVEATARHPSQWPGSGATSGIGAVRAMVSQLTGRPVDAVLVADLWGVIKVVDAMGGIDINVPAAVHDDHYPDPVLGSVVLDIPRGSQHFDGRTALAYARSRHQDSDYGRMARQQTLLLAIRSQLDASTILKAPSLFKAAKGFTWTDLPRSSLPNLVDLFSRADTASVKQLRIVPSRYPAYLTAAEITQIQSDIAKLLGTVPPPTPPPSATPSPAPSGSATPSPSPAPSDTPAPSPSPAPSDTPTPGPSAGSPPP